MPGALTIKDYNGRLREFSEDEISAIIMADTFQDITNNYASRNATSLA